MAKGSGSTKASSPRTKKTAGSFGFEKLGEVSARKTNQGLQETFTKQLTQSQLTSEAQRYINTGRWSNITSKGYADEIAKTIATDLRARGVDAQSNKQYIETYIEGYTQRVAISLKVTKTKDYDVTFQWQAKASSSEATGYKPKFRTALDGIYDKKRK